MLLVEEVAVGRLWEQLHRQRALWRNGRLVAMNFRRRFSKDFIAPERAFSKRSRAHAAGVLGGGGGRGDCAGCRLLRIRGEPPARRDQQMLRGQIRVDSGERAEAVGGSQLRQRSALNVAGAVLVLRRLLQEYPIL